jgi:hypothetical protein
MGETHSQGPKTISVGEIEMRFLEILGLLIGSMSTSGWPSYVAWPRYFRSRAPQGSPPTDYEILTQSELLAQFSDAQGRYGITPRSLRNFVGSTIVTTPGGAPVAPIPLPGWTTANRPTGLVGVAMGYNYDLKQLDLWDDVHQTWVNPAFQGGLVAGDVVFAGTASFQHAVGFSGETGFIGRVNLGANVYVAGLPNQCGTSGRLYNNGGSMGVSP